MRTTTVTVLFTFLLCVLPLSAQDVFYANGSNLDMTTGGTNDINVHSTGGVNPPSALGTSNGATQAQACYYCTLASVDCDDVDGKAFSTSASFWPGVNSVILVKQEDGAGGSSRFGAFKASAVSASGVTLEFKSLGACSVDPPPVSNFTSTSYDLIGFFTDTSTNSPTSWSWNFADGGMSSSKNPVHFFTSASTFNVSLTASNAGGTGTTVNKNVTVTARPSDVLGANDEIDFDSDGTNDLRAISQAGCSGNLIFRVINGAKWGSANEDYRTVTDTDVPPSITGTSDFCTQEGVDGLSDTRFIQTTGPSVAKFWTPEISGSQIRLESEVLTSSLPDPPTTSWTHTSYDLIGFFTDTSTGTPGSWLWSFGDGSQSTSQNPTHYFPFADTRSVGMEASNNGGGGGVVNHDVTVSERPSTVLTAGQTLDFDSDGMPELTVISAVGCSGDLILRVINGATWASAGEDYRTVDAGDIPVSITGTSDFCTADEVDGLTDTTFIADAFGSVFKMWTPVLSPSQVRIESATLSSVSGIFTDGFESGDVSAWTRQSP